MSKPPRVATLHDRILAELRDRILSGHWKPGHQLAFETDMAAAYGVSRMTMNKVLTQLTREGFLERRRKVGTVVALPRAQSMVMEIADIEREVESLGLRYAYRLVSRTRRAGTREDQAALRTAGPAEVLAVTAVHSANGEPFCLEDRLINLGAAPAAAEADLLTESPGRWLLRNVPWSEAEHRIRAIGASAPAARLLAIRPGEPCLEVHRRTEGAGTSITWARLLYPGGRHQLIARFSPGAG